MSAKHPKPKFELGEIIADPCVLRATLRDLRLGGGNYMEYLMRQSEGDWGEVSYHVRELNVAGVQSTGLLRSRFTLKDGTVLMIVTEGDRSRTTLRLCDQH